MRVIVTGGSGFVGTHLVAALREDGHAVTILDLIPPRREAPFCRIDLSREKPPSDLLARADAIIHLAGRNIFGRWSERVKKSIYESRIVGTRNLVSALAFIRKRPRVLISASAVGVYGDRGEEELFESSLPGNDFLARVCIDWEHEARQGEAFGLRTVQLRTAPVLGHGGLLKKLLPLYKLGLGGPLGKGAQWFPWIHLHDLVRIFLFALVQDISGPVNASAPRAIRNADFSAALATVLKRHAPFRIPRWALRFSFGELGDVMLASQKVYPQRLLKAGFTFAFPEITKALVDILYP